MRLLSILLGLCSLLWFGCSSRPVPAPETQASRPELRFVEYTFGVPPVVERSPFARKISVSVTLPDGTIRDQPAFYIGSDRYAVRVFPRWEGAYVFGVVQEAGKPVAIHDPSTARVESAARKDSFIRIDPNQPKRFVRGTEPYFPVGANLPWALGPVKGFYPHHFALFRDAGLNWARVWMAHWAEMNLDWLPDKSPVQVPLGELSLTVASTWDEIVAAAEDNGVAFQMVFQHHGQVSRNVNPNWDAHPWNKANGGFLNDPVDFFTDERARQLTRQKYRYIVARWGYSPAVMSWELFNEVHYSAALQKDPPEEEAVASWHAEMADFLRSVDPERHLVATSYDKLGGALYSKMDYLQPHLYAAEMNAAVLSLPFGTAKSEKPVFFGEIGDDQLTVSPEDKANGESLLTPIWLSLMGDAEQMGQTWYIERLIDSGRLDRMGAVSRFVQAARLPLRQNMRAIYPTVQTDTKSPLTVEGTLWWLHYPVVDIPIQFDGSVRREQAFLPKNLVAASSPNGTQLPSRASLRFTLPTASDVTVKLGRATEKGAEVEVRLNGKVVARHAWPANAPETTWRAGASLTFPAPAGPGHLEIENRKGDWCHLDQVTFGTPAPTVLVTGKGNDTFVMAVLWNRLFVSGQPLPQPASGSVLVPGLAPGRWRSIWWDTESGTPRDETFHEHLGGDLRLPFTGLQRRAALMLEKLP